jgi:hypothetical protein
MRTLILITVAAICFFAWFTVGSFGNLQYIKDRAEDRWAENGYVVNGYLGYQWGIGGYGTPYGGAKVWYTLRKPDNNLNYKGFLYRWGNEIHIYETRCIDAVSQK